MRRTGVVVTAVVVLAFAAFAQAGTKVGTKVFMTNALAGPHGKIDLLGGVDSKEKACLKRVVLVFNDAGDEKIGRSKSVNGSWDLITGEVGSGDEVYAKVKRKRVTTDSGRVLCKGAKSKTFEIP